MREYFLQMDHSIANIFLYFFQLPKLFLNNSSQSLKFKIFLEMFALTVAKMLVFKISKHVSVIDSNIKFDGEEIS